MKAELAALRLRPDGARGGGRRVSRGDAGPLAGLLNVVDAVDHRMLRSVLRTLRSVFPYVVVAEPVSGTDRGWPPPARRSTFVVVAALRTPLVSLPVFAASDLDAFLADDQGVLLTDDHAPVEQLMAPVFAKALQDGR